MNAVTLMLDAEVPTYRPGAAPCCEGCDVMAGQCTTGCAEMRTAGRLLRHAYRLAALIAREHDEETRKALAESVADIYASAIGDDRWWDDEHWFAACNPQRVKEAA